MRFLNDESGDGVFLVTTVFYRNDGDTSLHDKLHDKLQEKLQDKLPDKLIRLIQDDESVTIEQLSKTLEVSEKTVRMHLKRLVEKGLIVRVGARKNGHWQVNRANEDEKRCLISMPSSSSSSSTTPSIRGGCWK